jgi:hypothetical protein
MGTGGGWGHRVPEVWHVFAIEEEVREVLRPQ